MKRQIFSTADVKALIEGRKTKFSLPIVKLKGFGYITEFQESKTLGFDWAFRDRKQRWNEVTTPRILASAPFLPGDKIGVREKWCFYVDETGCTNYSRYLYYADNPHVECRDADGFLAYTKKGNEASPWQSPVTMPREAIRLFMEITAEVKAEKNESGVWEWVYSCAPATKGESK